MFRAAARTSAAKSSQSLLWGLRGAPMRGMGNRGVGSFGRFARTRSATSSGESGSSSLAGSARGPYEYLDGLQVDSHRQVVIVTKEKIDSDEAGIVRAVFAELVLVALGGDVGIRGDHQTLMRVVRWQGSWVRRGSPGGAEGLPCASAFAMQSAKEKKSR